VTRRVIFYLALSPKFIMAIPGSQATPFHAHLYVLTWPRFCSHTRDHVHLPMTSFTCSWPCSLTYDFVHMLVTTFTCFWLCSHAYDHVYGLPTIFTCRCYPFL